ncbi:MAG: cadherin-like domain-containing protein [Zoogloeaceae bacterium]|nr:cadherin-like domain-containing protein [Zoogloeaceae bacterium]
MADPIVTVSDVTVVEGDGTFGPSLSFVVSLSEAATVPVVIDYQSIDATARETLDYDAVRGQLTIAAGQTTGTIVVNSRGGGAVELDESFILELSNPQGAVFADGVTSLRAAGTILDNDGTGDKLALLVDDLRVVEGDSGQREAVFLVRLSRDPGTDLTLDFATSDGSAVAGSDYVAMAGSLTFSAGGALVQEVRVPVLGDALVEGSESFSLTVESTGRIANGALGASGSATILDDDGSIVLPTLSIASAEVLESNGTFSADMQFVVTLSEPATSDVVFRYQTISGSAKEGFDFDGVIGTFTIAAGQTSAIVSVTTRGGTELETDESFILELTNIEGAVFAGDATRLQAQGVILDNDGSGADLALIVGNAQLVEGDAGQSEAVFEVRLSQPSDQVLTFSYVTRDGSARAGSDYQQRVGTVTFQPGETIAAVSVPVFGDGVSEASETFSLVLTPTPEIASGASTVAGVATILDDDGASGTVPTLSISSAEILEGDGTFSADMQFVVTLSEPASSDVQVSYQSISGSAEESVDFDAARGTLTIAAGQTSAIISVTTRGGTGVEADESFTLELTNVQGAVFAGDALRLQAQGVILDNDGTGAKLALIVSDAQVVEGDGGQHEALFEVRLSQPVDEAVTVHYTTAPGTASSGSDYEPVQGVLTFLPGQTVAAVSVPVFGDTAQEASETFSLVLSAPQGSPFAAGAAGAEGVATILDDDAGEPVISIAPTEVREGNGTFGADIQFVVSLSAPSTEVVRVDFTTADGTALAGSDYDAASGTLTFAPGQTSAIVSIVTRGGSVEEADETFLLQLSNPQNAALAGGVGTLSATGTILDNDAPATITGLPVITVADIQVTEAPGGATATFELVLSSPSASTVSGSFAVQAGTATAGADFTASSGSFSFEPGQTSVTIDVPVLEDTLVEDTETFVLRLTDLQNAAFEGGDAELLAIGDIIDRSLVAESETYAIHSGAMLVVDAVNGILANDPAGVTILAFDQPANGTLSLQADGGFRYTPNRGFKGTETIDYTTSDGVDTATASFTINVIDPLETVTVEAGTGTALLEGETLTRTVVFTDGEDNGAAGWTYEVDYGDGNTESGATLTNAINLSHTYADGDASYPVTVTVTDEPGESASGSFNAVVFNVPPSLDLGGADAIDEGTIYQLTLVNLNDPGQDTITEIAVDWGDGSALEVVPGLGSYEHAFAQSGLYTIRVQLTDEDGVHQVSRDLAVGNVAPVLEVRGASTTDEGASYVLAVSATDPAGAADPIQYTIDWGDGSAAQVLSQVQLDALGGNVDHVFADDEDGPVNATVRTVTVTADDGDGGVTTSTFDVTVNNVAPTLSLLAPNTVTENEAFFLSGLDTLLDPGQDTPTGYAIDWGDGQVNTFTPAEFAALGGGVEHGYDDGPGTVVIQVLVTDEDGTFVAGTRSIEITNADPILTIAGADSADEGSVYTLNVGATDLGNAFDPLTYTVDWGDGIIEVFTETEVGDVRGDLTHVYDDEGGPVNSTPYTIAVTVDDGDGGSDTATQVVTIANIAPTIALTGAASVEQGQAFTLTLGAVTDPGTDTVTSYVIDWGDGSTSTVGSAGDVNHVYATQGAFAISVALVDEDGTHADAGSTSVSVTAPTATLSVEAGADASLLEGETLVRSVAFSDGSDDGAAGWSYEIDYGDGTVVTGSTLVRNVDLDHTYTDGDAQHVVTLTLTDEAGESASDSFTVNVANVAPTLDLVGADTVDEGSPYTLTLANLIDPGADTVIGYSIDWGDSSPPTGVASLGDIDHTFADDGDYTITVTATDEDGSYTFTKPITVANVAPEVTLSGADGIDEGSTYQLGIEGVDPGIEDTLSFDIDWGDGSAVQTLTAAELQAQGAIFEHVFSDDEDGPVNVTNRSITVTARDGDGGVGTASRNVAVSNVAPLIALSGATSIEVSASYTLTLGAITDPGLDIVTSFTIDWGDGSSEQAGSAGPVTHIYASEGPRTIVVSLEDEDGTHADAGSLDVLVTPADPGNTAPVANADSYSVYGGRALSVDAAAGVLANDSDADGDALSVVAFQPAANGVLDMAADGSFAFAPNAGFTGTEILSYTLSDGTTTVEGTLEIVVEPIPVETVRIGDAPTRLSRTNPDAWETAWSHPDIEITHKAVLDDAQEDWSPVVLRNLSPLTLAGGDSLLGDLGVSGQTLASSAVRQELDGTEGLRFELQREAVGVTADLSRFFLTDDGTVFAEAGRIQFLDADGTVLGEHYFTADSVIGDQTVSVEFAAGFDAVAFSAGALNGNDFVFGAYSDPDTGSARAAFNDDAGQHGSEFMLDWIEFDFVALPPALATDIGG